MAPFVSPRLNSCSRYSQHVPQALWIFSIDCQKQRKFIPFSSASVRLFKYKQNILFFFVHCLRFGLETFYFSCKRLQLVHVCLCQTKAFLCSKQTKIYENHIQEVEFYFYTVRGVCRLKTRLLLDSNILLSNNQSNIMAEKIIFILIKLKSNLIIW